GVGGPSEIDLINSLKLANGEVLFSVKEFNLNQKQLNSELQNQFNSFQKITEYIHKQRKKKASIPSMWPTTGRITSGFRYRVNPITGRMEFHKGIDIANRRNTSIMATADGVVKHAGWCGGYGKVVIIKHGHGYSTLYAHLSKILVRYRQKVKRGDVIAAMGSTGISTGTHLHYEIRYFNKPKNPLHYVGRRKRG
ncbi:M23 family metallopeptidase, partial [bacterium]